MGKQTPKTKYDTAYVKTLEATVEEQKDEILRLRQKLERMNEQLLNAQRARFGQSSEKKAYVMADGEQLQLFNEAEAVQDAKAPEPTVEEVTVAAHKRKKKRTYEELAEDLPVEEILLELSGDQLICEKCGGTFRLIGKKFVKSEIICLGKAAEILRMYLCLRPLRERDRLRAYCGNHSAAVSHEAQSGVPILGGGGHDEEIRRRRTAGAAGEDLEA